MSGDLIERESRESRRTLLLEAACKVFGRNAVEEVSLQEIKKEAKVDAFYAQSQSKIAHFDELAVDQESALLAEIIRIQNTNLETIDKLKELTFAIILHLNNKPTLITYISCNNDILDLKLESNNRNKQTAYAYCRTNLIECLTQLISNKNLKQIPIELLLEFYINTIQACIYYSHIYCNHGNITTTTNMALEYFLRGAGKNS